MKRLRNGIKDPSGLDVDVEYEDSEIELNLVDEDIVLQWAGGVPGTKVGYIIERKPAGHLKKQFFFVDLHAHPSNTCTVWQ